jgi:hypothetical protein
MGGADVRVVGPWNWILPRPARLGKLPSFSLHRGIDAV